MANWKCQCLCVWTIGNDRRILLLKRSVLLFDLSFFQEFSLPVAFPLVTFSPLCLKKKNLQFFIRMIYYYYYFNEHF